MPVRSAIRVMFTTMQLGPSFTMSPKPFFSSIFSIRLGEESLLMESFFNAAAVGKN
jgi:hypothetical protein